VHPSSIPENPDLNFQFLNFEFFQLLGATTPLIAAATLVGVSVTRDL